MKVEYGYELEEVVTIDANQRDATVIGLWMDRDAIKWVRVEYVLDNGQVQEGWFREKEVIKKAS